MSGRHYKNESSVKIAGAVLALLGAALVVTITEITVEFACEEREPCSARSAPTALRVMAWGALVGLIVAVGLARRHATAAATAATVAALGFLAWIPLFVLVVEGEL